MRPRSAIISLGRPLVVLALGALAAIVIAPASGAPSPLQTTFKSALLGDAKTSNAIRSALTSGAAIVDPHPVFADLTGDGKSDAVVPVITGGAAGAIAVYVFSTDGAADGKLRAVYRNQELYRAAVAVNADHTLTLKLPQYAPGDALCCAARVVQRTYAWVAKAQTLRATGSRTVAGPTAPGGSSDSGPGTTTTTTSTTTSTTPGASTAPTG